MRAILLATALLALAPPVMAQSRDDVIAAPVLRAQVSVSGELVRIGDLIDNAGAAGTIAVYRAPDLGTTGSLPIAQVVATLRANQVIGVDTRDLTEISVTRLARTLTSKDIELQVARAIEHRGGLGDAANLSLTFDTDPQDLRLDASNSGALQPVAARLDPRNGRFDVSLEIANDAGAASTRLRFTGTVIETVEAAVLTRNVDRNEILRASDIAMERLPRAETGTDNAMRDAAIGLQVRRSLRAGQPLKTADLAKPELVTRDQSVTLTYESAGIYLTIRGKALESGAEGDVVSVLNLQSKRTVTGTVTGRNQVSASAQVPRARVADNATAPTTLGSLNPAAPIAVAANAN